MGVIGRARADRATVATPGGGDMVHGGAGARPPRRKAGAAGAGIKMPKLETSPSLSLPSASALATWQTFGNCRPTDGNWVRVSQTGTRQCTRVTVTRYSYTVTQVTSVTVIYIRTQRQVTVTVASQGIWIVVRWFDELRTQNVGTDHWRGCDGLRMGGSSAANVLQRHQCRTIAARTARTRQCQSTGLLHECRLHITSALAISWVKSGHLSDCMSGLYGT